MLVAMVVNNDKELHPMNVKVGFLKRQILGRFYMQLVGFVVQGHEDRSVQAI